LRIKKLEIVGFKSFKDRTVIHFDAGITGIVGPNGCGKSNIVDALVWVMGEMSAKHLRGSSMEDVIFAGAEGYAPVGMAEVSLTLENDGGPFPVQYMSHSEIMVTRKLHRSGDSEYFVNREVARLKDIQEIFMDTGAGSKGFSIIEQGAIGRIITAKPEDRRMLIEEAAGITKFKVRKRESQRKLISTEQNLVRLADIVGELKRQIDSLQRQAQRAERYRNLKREIEDIDLWLTSRQYVDLRATTAGHELAFTEAQAQEIEAQASSAAQEAELEGLRARAAGQEAAVNDRQGAHYELKLQIQKAEAELQELRFEIEQARRNKEMTGSMLQENEARKGILEGDLERAKEQLEAARADAGRLSGEYALKKEQFDVAQGRIQEIDEELTTRRRELLTVSQGESHISARVAALSETIDSIGEREAEQRAVLEELLAKRLEFEGRRKKAHAALERERQMHLDIQRDVESYETNKSVLAGQIAERRADVESFKDQLNEVASRLYGLEDLASNFEGFEAGVKSVMFWQRSRLERMPEAERARAPQMRPVSEVVEVPAEYELAMEAALGPRLQVLLAHDAGTALSAVGYLKEKRSGRSSFFPDAGGGGLQMAASGATYTEAAQVRSTPGVRAVLRDVVRVPEAYSAVGERLLGGVAVVDDIDAAIRARAQTFGWTYVTGDGDLLSADGILTGGTAESAGSGMLKRRREMKELSLRKEELAGKLALAQATLKKLEEKLKGLTDELEAAAKRGTEKEVLVAEHKKDLERAENEFHNAQHAISRQEKDVLATQGQIDSRRAEMEGLGEKLDELRARKAGLEESSEGMAQELQVARGGIDELQDEATRLRVLSATKTQERDGLERQVEMLSRSFGDVEAQLARMTSERLKSTETMSSAQIALEERKVQMERLIQQSEELAAQVSGLRDEFEASSARVRELEKLVGGALSLKSQLQARMNEAQLHMEQAKMKEAYLVEQVRERYILSLPEVAERYAARDGDLAEAERELKDLRDKIARIGDVNLSAIEEYDEVATRYEFLVRQQQDLIEAKEQLKKVIDRINRICSRRFRETFEQVNERFTKAFPVLFGGGEAHLTLIEDLEKGGEMGIDIVAKPPGKKPQNVSLLSGGEKALTAVALIFSIFLVKPSPYCLLDEVDAPLDDANVFRFNDLVKEMAKRSQIIVVTHNKFTMEVASKLYGVTMQEKGVSKMVSVNLGEARQVAVV
jgi:chromosome segregation protein